MFLAKHMNEFGPDAVLAVCESEEIAERLIKKDNARFGNTKSLIDNGNGTFKKRGETDGEEYHYFIEPIKLNKLL